MKKSRKRLLISSIAMLLVAMLALGTATFAWFTTSTTATANGINVRTSKTSTLKISDNARDYGTGFSYSEEASEFKPVAIMLPASSANGTNWYATIADNTNAFDPKTSETPAAVSDAKHVYMNQLNIQNAGAVAVNDITITISGLSSSYGKVAVVPVESKAQTGKAVVAIPSGVDFKNFVFADAATQYAPITAAGALPTATDAKITPKAATGGTFVISKTTPGFSNLASLNAADESTAAGELHYNIYVWFEGQDSDCKDANAGTNPLSALEFTVSGTPVEG